MSIHFIAAEIDLKASTGELLQEIEAALQRRGEPLRWAVVSVDKLRRKVLIEAVVTVTE
ncbi:MAG: hypothetical protein MJA27_18800 [Pseudanabaenales cyanobacterium]|nr:hypothetical protein [Pseudanabaenales cyanobacterium]